MLANTSGNGIVIGEVINLEDPDKLGRIQVSFPLHEDQPSNWARLATTMAGKETGVFFRPEVGDEVLVAFEQGEATRPYILGSLWSQADKPPADDGKVVENNWRFIRSRSGHVLKFDDTKGKERIELESQATKRRVIMDDKAEKITVQTDAGDIEISAEKGNIIIKANVVKVEAKEKVEVTAKDISVKGDASLKIEAPQIDMKASASMNIDGGGSLKLKAGIININ